MLTGLTNLDMAGQRDVYGEIDSLGEKWMRDVSGESSLRRGPRARPLTLARSHFPTLTHQRVSHIINQTRRKICCSKMQLVH